MKIDIKRITKSVPDTLVTYTSSDGYPFANRNDCEWHERRLGYKGIEVVETAQDGINEFFTERPITMYNIKNEEDWNILVERVWFYRQDVKEYPGPGIYLAMYDDGGDSSDSYIIYDYKKYIWDLQDKVNTFISDLSYASSQFDT